MKQTVIQQGSDFEVLPDITDQHIAILEYLVSEMFRSRDPMYDISVDLVCTHFLGKFGSIQNGQRYINDLERHKYVEKIPRFSNEGSYWLRPTHTGRTLVDPRYDHHQRLAYLR